MRILALETTERVGSLAAMDHGNVLVEKELSHSTRTAQSLVPAMGQMLDAVGWRPANVQLVAVTQGPGSFTGLRIGITAAKTFAYAAGCHILGVDTLETIAAGVPEAFKSVSVAVDAQRGEVVAGLFRRDDDGWFGPVEPAKLIAIESWLANLPPETPVTGPVLRKLAEVIPSHVHILDAVHWPAKASQVARLAERLYGEGRRDDPFALTPHYSRRSAAEEKWAQRHSSNEP